MVAWISDVAGRLLDMLPERRRRSLWERIDLTDQEIETWKEMSRKMYVPFLTDGVISQFEGGRTWRNWTGMPIAASMATSSGSTASCGRRERTRPLQAVEAGGRRAVVLPVPAG